MNKKRSIKTNGKNLFIKPFSKAVSPKQNKTMSYKRRVHYIQMRSMSYWTSPWSSRTFIQVSNTDKDKCKYEMKYRRIPCLMMENTINCSIKLPFFEGYRFILWAGLYIFYSSSFRIKNSPHWDSNLTFRLVA